MDPVSRSRMERLGKLRSRGPEQKRERNIQRESPVGRLHNLAGLARLRFDGPPRLEESRPEGTTDAVLQRNEDHVETVTSVSSSSASMALWTVGQPIDAALVPATVSSQPTRFRNATILDIDASNGKVLVGFRLYHENGPFTEPRDPKTKAGREALRLALIAERHSGERAPPRYYGVPGEHWRGLSDLAQLGTRATNLLEDMGVFGQDVVQSLARRMLRHSRELAHDTSGAAAMDKAMAAYQASQGPLYFYSSPNGKRSKFDAWRAELTNSPVPLGTKINTYPHNNNAANGSAPEREDRHFVPSLKYNGEHLGYRYELQDLGLGYYAREPDPETLGHNQNRQLQIRDRRRELSACTDLIAETESELTDPTRQLSPAEENEKTTTLKVMREREIDLRVQLGMLLRQEIEAMWEQERRIRPPLADEHQCGPAGAAPIAMIREALEILRGALLIDSQNASARLNSIELAGMLPIMVRSEMFGASFTFDSVYAANPNVFPEFVQKRVPRTKFYDETYRTLRSYGGHNLPASAWLNSAVRHPGEPKDALRKRVNAVVICIQRCYLRRFRRRSHAATVIQTCYRKAVVRLAVERKVLREMRACTRIFAVWRGFCWRRELWYMNVAATKITSLARGKHGRWMAWLRRLVRDRPDAPYLVVRVQAMMRGVQSRWHRREAQRRLKSIRFLCRLGLWMLRVKKIRDCVIRAQSVVRRFITLRYLVPQQKLAWTARQALRIQRLMRGILGRRRALQWYKGILRLQGLGRAIKGRRLAGIELAGRLAAGAQRDADERRFVALRVREAVEQVDAVLATRPHGSHMIRSRAKRLRQEARGFWMKRVALRARLVGSSKLTPVMRRSRLAATFSKFDWHRNGRLGLRALKALIVDELCIPMSPEDFVRLSALLDDRIVGGVSGTGGADDFLRSLANGEEDGPRGLYVTFDTFCRWWTSRSGLRTVADHEKELWLRTKLSEKKEADEVEEYAHAGSDGEHSDHHKDGEGNIEVTDSVNAASDVSELETKTANFQGNGEEEGDGVEAGILGGARILSSPPAALSKRRTRYRKVKTPRSRVAGGARIAVVGGPQRRGHLHAVYTLRTKRAVRKLCAVVGCAPELAHQGGNPKFFAWNIGGVRGEAREAIIAKVVDRVFKDATAQFRAVNPPVAACKHCLRPFATVTDCLIHRDGSILASVQREFGKKPRKSSRRRSGMKSKAASPGRSSEISRTYMPCASRMLCDSDYMMESHTLGR